MGQMCGSVGLNEEGSEMIFTVSDIEPGMPNQEALRQERAELTDAEQQQQATAANCKYKRLSDTGCRSQ